MSIWEILLHPWRAQSEMGRLKGYEHTALELHNELNWLQDGPGVKNVGVVPGVDDEWIVRRYPLHAQPRFKTLREAIRYGRESE